jgi:alpha-beta hydrolase superfamily lysophospholipase
VPPGAADPGAAPRGLGHAVPLIDLPAHGESEGERTGFGGRESAAVAAALAWLRREPPGERVCVIGVSLGAAELVLAEP